MFKWWSKCISMVIAKTASRNVVYKATKLGESIFERQSEMLMPEEELGQLNRIRTFFTSNHVITHRA